MESATAEPPVPAATDAIVRCSDLRRRYGEGEAAVDALDGVTLEFPRGELTAIVGPSGSGKSTLMDQLLEMVGLTDRRSHRPSELSGGQQQRVAIARALASRPAVVFADEPTGNLDSRSSAGVLDILRRSVDEFGQTVVMVTHDPRVASYADRVIVLADGKVAADRRVSGEDEVIALMREI
jgi:ABC-type lipoprotein export system ATPase subunit